MQLNASEMCEMLFLFEHFHFGRLRRKGEGKTCAQAGLKTQDAVVTRSPPP